MPKLVFDDRMFDVPPNSIKLLKKHNFLEAMFHVLLLHRGLILGFTLSIHDVILVSEIDRIILHLSMRNSLKECTLETLTIDYELPSSFFKLQGLEQLVLKNCDFEPHITFNGFSKLRNVCFDNIYITPEMLQSFLFKCPLLEVVVLVSFGITTF